MSPTPMAEYDADSSAPSTSTQARIHRLGQIMHSRGTVTVWKIPTEEQRADPLSTKAVGERLHARHTSLMLQSCRLADDGWSLGTSLIRMWLSHLIPTHAPTYTSRGNAFPALSPMDADANVCFPFLLPYNHVRAVIYS